MLVYLQKAYQRESATFEKKLTKQAGELDKKLRRLEKERYNCQSDAEKALDEIKNLEKWSISGNQLYRSAACDSLSEALAIGLSISRLPTDGERVNPQFVEICQISAE